MIENFEQNAVQGANYFISIPAAAVAGLVGGAAGFYYNNSSAVYSVGGSVVASMLVGTIAEVATAE